MLIDYRSLLKNATGAARFAAITFVVTFATSTYAAQITPCAIRWDAWYAPTSSSLAAQERLSPTAWQSRAPKHCTILAPNSVRCTGSQDVIDAEIISSVDLGGVTCWAFDKYTKNSSLTVAWNLFQSSAVKNRINWTWITSPALFGQPADRSKITAELVEQMHQRNYQKVDVGQQNRPVLFILWSDQEFKALFEGDYSKFNEMLRGLSTKSATVGLGAPYVIILGGVPERTVEIARNVGADAVGTYNVPLSPNKLGSFESLSRQTRSFWSRLAATKMTFVPTVMTGFDQRPTYALQSPKPAAANEQEVVYSVATDDQLTSEVKDATHFINDSSNIPSKLLLIYSWNENSEGGGSLNETLGDPTGNRLRAFKRGLIESGSN